MAESIKNKTIELNNVRYERMAKIGSEMGMPRVSGTIFVATSSAEA